MTTLDPRLTPARPDLASTHLRGIVEAERYVDGRRCQVVASVLDLKRQPRPDSALDTQVLRGEILRLYDEEDGWAWVQAERDGYVGYVPTHGLCEDVVEPTHLVVATRTFVYPAADMKQPVRAALPLAARVAVGDIVGSYARLLGDGYVFLAHLAPIEHVVERDVVSTAERLLGVPYLWGGRTPQGVDCSGLVQLGFALAGFELPRDTHMQETNGRALSVGENLDGLERGDLVFWRGHVGLMCDSRILLHANAHQMRVSREPLRAACARIAASPQGSPITSIRRLTTMNDRPS